MYRRSCVSSTPCRVVLVLAVACVCVIGICRITSVSAEAHECKTPNPVANPSICTKTLKPSDTLKIQCVGETTLIPSNALEFCTALSSGDETNCTGNKAIADIITGATVSGNNLANGITLTMPKEALDKDIPFQKVCKNGSTSATIVRATFAKKAEGSNAAAPAFSRDSAAILLTSAAVMLFASSFVA